MSTPNLAPNLKLLEPVVFSGRNDWTGSVNLTAVVSKSFEVNSQSEFAALVFAETSTSALHEVSHCLLKDESKMVVAFESSLQSWTQTVFVTNTAGKNLRNKSCPHINHNF